MVKLSQPPIVALVSGISWSCNLAWGICKVNILENSELTMEVGGWVQVSLGKTIIGKSSQNSSILVLIYWSTMCILFVYTLLKIVSYYDLSVLSMSAMGLKKVCIGGGWGELYPVLFWIFWIFLTLQCPLPSSRSSEKCASRSPNLDASSLILALVSRSAALLLASSSSSISSKLPISLTRPILIRLAMLCMSSSLWVEMVAK